MKAKYLFKGLLKSIPGIEYVYNFHSATGGTNNARYCYAVWLRHLVLAYENGMNSIPRTIAELGPGDSLGIGLSALISGSEKYYALDIVKFADREKNLAVFEELVKFFRNKTSVPAEQEFPRLKPQIKSYEFPSHIFSDEYLEKMLNEERLQRIRDSIMAMDTPSANAGSMIQYKAPWHDNGVIERGTIDMVFSQAVLQHIDELEMAYRCMGKWLKKDGLISHSIDFKCMGSSDTWDGHWAYSEAEWKIVRGRKKYLINREPLSAHLRHVVANGFRIICSKKIISDSSFDKKEKLADRFKNLSNEDLTTSGVFIQAVKFALFPLIAAFEVCKKILIQNPEVEEAILFLA